MPDREKVLTGLKCCINNLFDLCPYHCPYYAECMNRVSFAPLLADCVKLLKAQEKQKFFVNESGKITPLPEIVRCKDCKNWIAGYITDQDDFIPSKCGKYKQMVGHSSDDFCSFAERRELE